MLPNSEYSRWLFKLLIGLILCTSISAYRAALPPLVRSDIDTFDAEVNALSADHLADADVDYRLPNDTLPIHYDVTLTTQVHIGVRDFTGTVKIEIEVITATSNIVLHSRQLSLIEATLNSFEDPSGTPIPVTCTSEAVTEFLTCSRNDNAVLEKGSKWILTIQYKGQLRTDNGGFYLSTFEDDEGKERYLATTQFESTDARHGFPCFDEPTKRATFTISIEHDPSYHAISNMPVDEEESSSGFTVFQKTVKMPTYIVAFIVSDFKYTEGVLYGLPQRIYSRAGTEHEQEWALVSGMLLLQRLAEYFDVAYPLPKEDQVAVPDFAAGAMENWGLVTYREEYLLYNEDTSTINTKTSIANVIAHEYTHQWFGNLVAIKWWTYLWLKEGFAELFSWVAMDEAYPEWGVFQQFHVDDYHRAMNNDASNSPRPLTHYVQKPDEISRLYDAISYAKGASVNDMWRHALTDKVYRRGLHNYLTANEYSNGEEDDLFEGIQIAAKEENFPVPATVKEMFSTWTQQGGYPVITVTRNYDDGSFNLTQEAFFNDETHSEPSKVWYVPINYVVGSNPDFRDTVATHFMRKEKEITISNAKVSEDEYLLLNKQSTGYYRINYDTRNWELITEALKDKYYKIHPRNRAQLMHDAYRFSSSNRLSHEILLNLMTYLENEDQYAPWATANTILTTFNRYLSSDEEYTHFQSFVSALVNDAYDQFGINDVSGEHHYRKFTRNVLINLACLAGIRSCLEETNTKLKNLVDNGIAIEPNLQAQTYCNGLRQSDDKEFNFVYNKWMNSENQAERRILVSSLGCAQNQAQITKFIESSTDQKNNLRAQERTTILSSAYSRGEVGLLASIDFLDKNWQEYAELTVATFGGSRPLNDDIIGMSQYVVNKQQEEKLLALVDKVKDSEHVDGTLKETVDRNIESNYAWLSLNRDPVMSWVKDFLTEIKTGGSSTLTSSCIVVFMISLVNFVRLL